MHVIVMINRQIHKAPGNGRFFYFLIQVENNY